MLYMDFQLVSFVVETSLDGRGFLHTSLIVDVRAYPTL